MFRTILVALDTSERAAHVLATALQLAERYDARLSIIRAAGIPVEFPIEALTPAPDGLPARLLELTQQNLERALAELPKKRVERIEARIGTPWQVICDTAKEIGAELIVLGTHGHSALDRLLGTTAARVTNHAPCSVMVVRSPVA